MLRPQGELPSGWMVYRGNLGRSILQKASEWRKGEREVGAIFFPRGNGTIRLYSTSFGVGSGRFAIARTEVDYRDGGDLANFHSFTRIQVYRSPRRLHRASIQVVWRRFDHVSSFQVVARRYEPPELFTGLEGPPIYSGANLNLGVSTACTSIEPVGHHRVDNDACYATLPASRFACAHHYI